ncbi:peptide chain release factor N(5)-glutamine methyltransferase [Polaromonas sp. YR568]|uniref:peptide chain release factor N(5)-glutamine methyltransferase n=1 Tax=Polaromonas sp. YR568 TaxID=1855301 RepID=UPI00313849EF
MNQPTLSQALTSAQTLGLDRLDAQLLLLHTLGKSADERAWLLAHDTDLLADEQAARYQTLCLRRAQGEPVAYLVGHKEFFGLDLQVDPRVLVPRPDTETLVQWALDVLAISEHTPPHEVLDLGTGSGAIALAICHVCQSGSHRARVVAVDASADALQVARSNATRLGLPVEFMQSHWLNEVSGHFHVIVSNPPYVASGDPHLDALVHEPLQALAAGPNGLDDLQNIVQNAPRHLLAGGWLLLEHGHDQATAVRGLLVQQGFMQVQSRKDLAGIERCSGGQWPGG